MTRVLLDTNVLLDLLLQREPWAADAEAIRLAHTEGRISAYITASSITDVFYVARRLAGRDKAWEAVRSCLDHFPVISVGAAELLAAAASPGGDFEDNLQAACAAVAGLDMIVSRDLAGIMGSSVPVLEPAAFLATLKTA